MTNTIKALEVVKEFKNGSKNVIVEVTCSRCSGLGVFKHLKNIDSGKCFKCSGTGVETKQERVSSEIEVIIVNPTTEIKKLEEAPSNESKMFENAFKRIAEEKKEAARKDKENYQKYLDQKKEIEEYMKNNPFDFMDI